MASGSPEARTADSAAGTEPGQAGDAQHVRSAARAASGDVAEAASHGEILVSDSGREPSGEQKRRRTLSRERLGLFLGTTPLVVFIVAVAFLASVVKRPPTAEPRYLLPILNTVFLFGTSCIVAQVAMRSYRRSGIMSVLMLGCGVLTLGTGGLISGWSVEMGYANAGITSFNISILLGAVFHVLGLRKAEKRPESDRWRTVVALYALVVGVSSFAALGAATGVIPPFFRPGIGPTLLRQVVVLTAFSLYILAAVCVLLRFIQSNAKFFFWYALALSLIAVSIPGILGLKYIGSITVWAARGSQYLAGVYFLLAVAATLREARARGGDLLERMAEIFRTSLPYWQDILYTVSDAIISCDSSGRIVQWNPAAERVFGYTDAEAAGKPISLILPEGQTLLPDFCPPAERIESSLRTRDGAIIVAEISSASRHLSIGEITTYVIRDVTERKERERELRESRDTIANIIESINDNFFCLDGEWRFTVVNSEAERQFQKPREELLGSVVWELFPESVGTSYWDHYHRSMEEGVPTVFEAYYPPHDTFTEVRVFPTDDGIAVYCTDISARKQAERDLQASEERLRLAQTAGAIGIYDWNISDNSIVWSDGLEKIYGCMQPARTAESHEWWISHVHLEDQERLTRMTEEWLQSDRPEMDWEYRFIRPDGAERWIAGRSIAFRDDSGRAYRVIGTNVDVTDRKQTEEELATRERLFRAAFENTGVGMALGNLDGAFMSTNGRLEEMLGYGPGELVGVHRNRLTHPDDRALTEALYSRLSDGVTTYEKRYIRKDGRVIWVRINSSVVRDGSGNALFGVISVEDITASKEAQVLLQQSEARFRAIYENAATGIAAADMITGRFVLANHTMCDMLGYTEQELLSRTLAEVTHPADTEADMHFLKEMHEGRISSFQMEKRYIRKDGRVIWGHLSASLVRDHDGRPVYAVGLVEDITDRKQAEEDLVRARAETERTLAELQTFYSSIAEGVALFDVSGKMISLNDSGRRILGLEPGEVPKEWGNAFARFTLDGEPLRSDELPVMRSIKTGEIYSNVKMRTVRRDGTDFIFEVSSAPVTNTAGDIIGAIIVFRDATDRVKLEEREKHIANVLQEAIIPPDAKRELNGYVIASRYKSGHNEAEIGGDFYDAFDMGDGKFGIVIGDVAGKGLGAAIRVAAARHSIRAYAYMDPRPARVMAMANEALCRSQDKSDDTSMLTAFLAIVDTEGGTMAYTNAGHEPPVVRSTTGGCEELSTGGLPIGITDRATYTQTTRRIEPGDVIVMVTDGITEARAPGVELFGKDRLVQLICGSTTSDVEELASSIVEAAKSHAGDLQDDAAVVVFSPAATPAE